MFNLKDQLLFSLFIYVILIIRDKYIYIQWEWKWASIMNAENLFDKPCIQVTYALEFDRKNINEG